MPSDDWFAGEANRLREENARLRAALEQIAQQGPGFTPGWKHWIEIAEEALAREDNNG